MLLAELRTVGIPKVDSRGIFYSKRLLEVMGDRERYRAIKRNQREQEQFELEASPAGPAERIESKNGRKAAGGVFGFDAFYANYPRKPGPAAARKVWARRVSPEDVPRIMESLEKHKQSDAWQRDEGKYIPLPSTWLEQRRWEAEFEPAPGSAVVRLKPPEEE